MLTRCLGGMLAMAMAMATAQADIGWPGGATAAAPSKQALSASEHGLPAHWRVYQIKEPQFRSPILVAEAGPPDASPLLLIHGLGQKGLRDWLPLIPVLEPHYRLILLDLPGFGASAAGVTGKLTPSRYAQLLHGIKPMLSDRPLTLVGHSMGGAVALRYAASFPDDVSRLLLLDVAGILQRTAFVKHSALDRLSLSEPLPDALVKPALGLQNLGSSLLEKVAGLPDPSRWLARNEQAWGLAFAKTPNLNAALGLIGEDFGAALHELRLPVALLWGGQDRVAPLRSAQVLQAALPQASLTLIEEAGHVPMASHPERVTDWLLLQLANPAAPPEAAAPATAITAAPAADTGSRPSQTLDCAGQPGGLLSGDFERLQIRGCRGLKLERLRARQIELQDSHLSMQEVQLEGPEARLTISRSSLLATACRFAGPIAVSASRLDFAGVTLQGELPFVVGERSRLLLSVSRSQRADGSWLYLHSDRLVRDGSF
ncbi:pimeloyl-ACP methyl ester carboxylesterase [Paucibacter oligotrophus]|uniref:Pimeloyl-ACP methyl ester carboxylesterase n=1 Tax=Roseateles oligotrophus TaxID=1769250 RepID=A0A840L5W1_9BURK|nr:alpha/beta hydrolase [Roseateles oligotrophus]MBB4843580.1 pimeloyl-ACP methyl ester carboxylesterase [Roseateles oligotrophus]